jgi:hypothetical protein
MSMSEDWTDYQARFCTDLHDFPFKAGLNKSSGQVILTLPGMLMTLLSGRVYGLSISDDLIA